MVKNTTGGTGTKSLARKHQSGGSKRLQLPEDTEFEKFACVTKMLGNGMCQVVTNDKTALVGHIRGKFKSTKNKRHNVITPNTIVLVGLRDLEKPPKNCDIMTIYDDNEINQLRQLPSINISHLLDLRICVNGDTRVKPVVDVEFTNETEDYSGMPAKELKEQEDFKMENMETIDIDDI